MTTEPTDGSPRQTRSPLFEAMNEARYGRQNQIRDIQRCTQRRLLTYICGPGTGIDQDDILGFVELLSRVAPNEPVDLMLHTGGGSTHVAEKIVSIVRERTGTDGNKLRVVVPHYAKSAGTMIVLGADSVVMSDSSELGPVDPQVAHDSEDGRRTMHSAGLYLATFDKYAKQLRENPDDPVAGMMLQKMDPVLADYCRDSIALTTRIAEGHLSKGMFRTGDHNVTRTASMLVDAKEWLSHGQVINHVEAAGPKVGLTVEYLAPDDPLWMMFWKLFCMQATTLVKGLKLYESDYVSLPWEIE